MKVLIDTHVLLWIVSGSDKLTEIAREVFLDPENDLYFSVAGYWELCIKVALGKLRLAENWPDTLKTEFRRNGILWLPVLPKHCESILPLPWIHRDPFDRLLIAQAKSENCALLTADANIHQYDVHTIW